MNSFEPAFSPMPRRLGLVQQPKWPGLAHASGMARSRPQDDHRALVSRELAGGDFSTQSSPIAPGLHRESVGQVCRDRVSTRQPGVSGVAVQRDFNDGKWLAVTGCESNNTLQHRKGEAR
jgi:hypothetical protein